MFFIAWLAPALFLNIWTGPALGATMTVEDSLGNAVAITLPVLRIVALNSDSLEVLRTLRAGEMVAGVFSEIAGNRKFWGDLAEKPKVGSWRDPDMEAIAALNPDLVIAYGWNPGPGLEEKMALFKIPVLRLDFYRIECLEREVRVLGQLLGREKEAAHFCGWHRRQMDMIREKITRTPRRPSVYVESYTDFHAAGPGSGGNEMCLLAGGRNIAGTLSIPYPRVTSEWVISQNPEVVIKAASRGNGYAAADAQRLNLHRDALAGRSAWNHIPAVVSGNIHVMDSAVWTGPRAIVGIAYMARWIHPAFFLDLDPRALHRAYLEKFQRVPYRGVFVSDALPEAAK